MNRTSKVSFINYRFRTKGKFTLNDIKGKCEFSKRTLSYCITDLNFYYITELELPKFIVYEAGDDISSDYIYKLYDGKTIGYMMESYFKQLGKIANENEKIKYFRRLLKGKTYWLLFLRNANLISEKSYQEYCDGKDEMRTNKKQIRFLRLLDKLESLNGVCMKNFILEENLKSEESGIYKYLSAVDIYLFDTEQNDKELRINQVTKSAKICDQHSHDEDHNWICFR